MSATPAPPARGFDHAGPDAYLTTFRGDLASRPDCNPASADDVSSVDVEVHPADGGWSTPTVRLEIHTRGNQLGAELVLSVAAARSLAARLLEAAGSAPPDLATRGGFRPGG